VGVAIEELLNVSEPPERYILIVDDDPFMREAVSMMVTSMGMRSCQAKGGVEALEQFQAQSEKISLVIMDVEMPELDGIQATHKMREIDPSAKVILCSGHTKQDVWKARPNAYLLKPFMHMDLRETVRNLLKREPLENTAAAVGDSDGFLGPE
jgi:two-component system chemotaxis response regulator CheY